MLQGILHIYHLEPLLHLGCMMMDLPWKFRCSRIGWHWGFLWGTVRALKYFPITVWYVAGCVASPRRLCFPPPNYDWMVYVIAFILRWISQIILESMTPSYFFILLKRDCPRISSGLEVILGHFGFTKLGVLEFSRINFTEFGVLEVFWNCQNPLLLCIGLIPINCACYFF